MSDKEQNDATIGEWLTVERLLFGLCILLGAAMRFVGLGAQPLSSMEAATAWASWLAAQGFDASNSAAGLLSATAPATSPLLYSLNAILFWLAGGSDVLARFLPAVLGTGMVVLAWHLRPHLGRWTALAVALLIAIDPWLVAYSRLVDGAILTAFFGLLTLIGLLNWANVSSSRGGWITLTAVSMGLLFVSGTQAWSFVPVLLLCFWLCCGGKLPFAKSDNADNLAGDDGDDSSVDDLRSGVGLSASGVSAGMWWGVVVGAALLGATGWLAFPQGLSYLSTSLSEWLAQITGGNMAADGAAYSLRWLWLRLLVDQPLLLIFGTIGLISLWVSRATLERKGWSLFLILWALLGIVFVLLPGRMPTTLLLINLPLIFAAAHVGGSLFSTLGQVYRTLNWPELFVFMALLLALSVATWVMVTNVVHDAQFQLDQARMLLIVAVVLIGTVVFFMLWGSRQQAMWMVSIFFFALLSLVAVSSSTQLSHRFDLRAPEAFFDEYSAPDIRSLTENIEVLSSQRIGDPNQATVIVALNGGPDPLLGWYLRDMQNLRWGSTSAGVATGSASQDAKSMPFLISYQRDAAMQEVVLDGIVADEQMQDGAPDGYLGSEYGLRLRWLPTDLPQYVAAEETVEIASAEAVSEGGFSTGISDRWATELRPLLRWMLYREVDGTPPVERVVLWVPVVEN